MPFEYRADPARRVIHVTGKDPLELAQALEVMDRQASEGAWTSGALIDMRGVAWVPSADEIRAVVDHIRTVSRQHGRRGPVAFVTSDKDALFGMLRMYSILADTQQINGVIRAFLSVEEANAWLDDALRSPR